MMACRTFGVTLRTALPKAFAFVCEKDVEGLCVTGCSCRLSWKLICAGMCDIVSFNSRGERARAVYAK